MSTYYVATRLANKTVNGKSYDERRNLLIKNMNEENGFWADPTSFYLVESSLDTYGFAAKACKGLSVKDDLVVVLGPVEHFDVLKSFFPRVKKLD
jgi:NifU-like protein involved in Fe-S cluster formation